MNVQCMLCDRIDTVDEHSLLAKKLRNRPLTSYMCPSCHDRIAVKAKERLIRMKTKTKDGLLRRTTA